jgi:two-component system response regulator AtoC
MVEEGKFRRDLFYRVNVVNIVVPPLRERKDDIPILVFYFLNRYCRMYNREPLKVSPHLMEMFLNYTWQGNVRELENNVKRLIILGNEAQLIAEFQRKQETGQYSAVPDDSQGMDPAGGVGGSRPGPARRISPMEGDTISGGNGGEPAGGQVAGKVTLKEVAKIAQRKAEKILIEQVLNQTRWNRRKAAGILDISYKALLYKIKECGLKME